MAEVFGIAAGTIGVVSLSIQLAESLQKVKSFYAAVKNAPTQVEELIEEIDIMQDILSDLESGSQSTNMASSASMQRCMKVAQRATKSFVAFSGQLQTRVKKSKFRGGIKFALSRDDIKEMLDQLERTKSSLNLAYSLYQQATAEDRHAALLSVASSSQGVAVGTVQKTVTLECDLYQVSRRSVGVDKRLFHMTTPEWISNTIWQFEMRRSIAGLNIMLRTYGVVPGDAPVLEACRTGDTIEMQRLFDNRLASPFDRSIDGSSLWQIAIMCSWWDSLRFLSQFHAASGSAYESDLVHFTFFHFNAQADGRDPVLGAGRRLRQDMIWLREHCSDAFGVPPAARLSTWHSKATRLLLCSPEDADSIWFWQSLERPMPGWNTDLSEETVKDMVNRYRPEHHGGRTPMQLGAVVTAYTLAWKETDSIQCITGIIAAIIATGAGVHDGDHHHTPMVLFLAIFVYNREFYNLEFAQRPRDLKGGLVVWLKILQDAGVDLISYGAEESRQHLAYCALEDPTPPLMYWHSMLCWNFCDGLYFTFSYGPEPQDWTVQLNHTTDQYFGEFWQMPGLLDEYGVRAMPGGWIDED